MCHAHKKKPVSPVKLEPWSCCNSDDTIHSMCACKRMVAYQVKYGSNNENYVSIFKITVLLRKC